MAMPAKLYLKKNDKQSRREESRIKNGHLWVFSNEVMDIEGIAENGDIVEIYDAKNNFLGYGFYNKNSLISTRLLGKSFEGDFPEYAKDQLNAAYDLRKIFYPDRESFRLCFSESDFMPGLIIDKYNSTFVIQAYSAGMELRINDIVSILQKNYDAKNIFTRNKPYFRKLEGLSEENSVYLGSIIEEIIDDGKIKYKIDFNKSQKTGFYFDQCDNREYIERFVKGKNVLDAFCNSGGFGLHAVHTGASFVDFVDSSETEISNAKYNFRLNGFETPSNFISEDVFDYLEKCKNDNKNYDVIILDPPAFAKNKKSVPTALKGYEKLNRLALQIINKNGFLITASCSHHIGKDEFISVINRASVKSGRQIQLLYYNGASLDHPQIPAMPETSYLKFVVFKVI
jgi:23S rRNA (cytosine1962-C5)-methyltransferase